jgi:hypothetical protein
MTLLPAAFADLEPFVAAWSLPSEDKRFAKRAASTMEEIRAFHDAMMPRIQAVLEYLDGLSIDALADDARRLLYLALSLAEIAPSIYFYNDVMPSDVIEPKRFRRWRVPHMTPEL